MRITGTRPWWRTLWKTPTRKAFTPDGIALGATVTDGRIVGQVWSRASDVRSWWVVSEDQVAHLMSERSMTVLGQCVDVELTAAA